jgi:hypothetical protein
MARPGMVKTFGAAVNARRNGAVPSALFTAPEKWDLRRLHRRRRWSWRTRRSTRSGRRSGSAPAAPAGPTSNKGTILDHFSLEVKGLDSFCEEDRIRRREGHETRIDKTPTV